jgi:hypothetical protein
MLALTLPAYVALAPSMGILPMQLLHSTSRAAVKLQIGDAFQGAVERLAKLEGIRDQLTPAEYDAKRAEIIEGSASAYDGAAMAVGQENDRLRDEIDRLRFQVQAGDFSSANEPYDSVPNGLDARTARILAPLAALATGVAFTVYGGSDTGSGEARPAETPEERKATEFYFPTAVSPAEAESRIYNTLTARGYTKENTLFGHSTCPDEVNTADQEIVERMKSRWGEAFALGGLAGLPFSGKTGFGAYAHHSPDEGRMLVLFAPHIGIAQNGNVGKLSRDGQTNQSSACGAVVGAYNALKKERQALGLKPGEDFPAAAPDGLKQAVSEYFDLQLSYIKLRMRARMKYASKAPNDVSYVTYEVYDLIRTLVVDEIVSLPSFWDGASEVTLVGGIMINRASEDRFQPLLFERRAENGATEDLFKEVTNAPHPIVIAQKSPMHSRL